MKKLLIVLMCALFTITAYAELSTAEKKLQQNIEQTIKSRGMDVKVNLTKIQPVPNSDFSVYKINIKSAEIDNDQYILFNGTYVADDLNDPINSTTVMTEFEYQMSAEKVDTSKLTLLAGKKGAKNTIVMFTDFDCSYCVKAHKYLEQKMKGRNDIELFIAHFPLETHPRAPFYARVFEAGMLQKMNFADELYTSTALQAKTEAEVVEYFAGKVKDKKKFPKDVESAYALEKVEIGTALAEEKRLAATPIIIINGKLIEGANLRMIDRAFNDMKK